MMAEDLKKLACEAIDQAAEDLHQLSHQIWSKPELCFEEHHAHEVLTKFMSAQGFCVEPKFILDTAFRATYDNGQGPNVAILCEYDALPDIGHACGHNLIAEVGVAASMGVKAALEQNGCKLGKLTVLGTPAEEEGAGKQHLIDAGAFKDIDVAMMAHPAPINSTDAFFMIARNTLAITYKGKPSHAAAFPWEGINALDAAVMAYTNIACLRQQFKPAWNVAGIITNGGSKPNIIPELTSMKYHLRAPTRVELSNLKERVTSCFEAAAKATGCQVEIKEGAPYDELVQNKTFIDVYKRNAADLGIQETKKSGAGGGASTDMGNVSHIVPSIHPMFYIGSDAINHTRPMTHAAGDPRAQPYTLMQAKALAYTAIDIMKDPELLAKIKNELATFKAST